MSNEKRKEALKAAIAQIEKKFGAKSIQILGSSNKMEVETVPTGSMLLDNALGVGGLPLGRIIEIFGPESSGKTTLTLHVIAEAQKAGKVCAFVDAEHALDPKYAKKLGVNLDELPITQPDNGEQALEIVDALTHSGAVDVIVVDSVAALVPRAELEGEMGDSHVGLQARLMSQALRKLTAAAKSNNVMIIFINQIRMKIGVSWGSPETTTGGNALKFYASVRLDIRRTGSEKEGEEIVANNVKIKVVKNKVAPPFREANTKILFNKGFDINSEILDLAIKYKLINKAGAWFSDAETGSKIGQGSKKVFEHFKQNPDYFDKIYAKIREKLSESDDFDDFEPSDEELEDNNIKEVIEE